MKIIVTVALIVLLLAGLGYWQRDNGLAVASSMARAVDQKLSTMVEARNNHEQDTTIKKLRINVEYEDGSEESFAVLPSLADRKVKKATASE